MLPGVPGVPAVPMQCQVALCKQAEPGCRVCKNNTAYAQCSVAGYAPSPTSGSCEPAVLSLCKGADPRCQFCRSATVCIQCASVNFVVGASGRCQLKPSLACTAADPSCSACKSATVCSHCKLPAQTVDAATGRCHARRCTDSDANCRACASASACSACKASFMPNASGKCVAACTPNCRTCRTAAACRDCSPGYYLSAGKCLKDTPSSNSCNADINCAQCLTLSRCKTCYAGFSPGTTGKCLRVKVRRPLRGAVGMEDQVPSQTPGI
ncbi:hypothetical protein ABPG75_004314 [Micractinium tetrahymenae]